METLEVLAHPVRLRIVHAMRGGRALTTTDLATLLPDVSQAMLYRHVGLLADAGILEVADERRVRGAVERVYRLQPERASIDPGTASSLTADDHRQGFAVAMAALIAEFTAYLDREASDVAADPIGYQQHALWLNPAELASFVSELRAVILPRLSIAPAQDRSRYLLSPILFPSEEPLRNGEPDVDTGT